MLPCQYAHLKILHCLLDAMVDIHPHTTTTHPKEYISFLKYQNEDILPNRCGIYSHLQLPDTHY